MSNEKYTYFTTPAGRYISGSIDIARTKDHKGNPKIIKRGPDVGKPTQSFDFGLAVPKRGERSFTEAVWFQNILEAAKKAWPNGQWQLDAFSWKVFDGDSTKPNTKMKRPCDSEGYPGHWIIYFSSNKAPQTVDRTGHNRIDPKSIKRGDWIQVAGSTCSNEDSDKPGMYMNHSIVSFQWADKAITSGPDPSQMGFGATPAPAGASTTPSGSFVAPAPAGASTIPSGSFVAPAPVVAPAAPQAPAPVMTPPPAAPAAPVPTVPHTAILVPPAPRGPVMTQKANGMKREDFIKQGWTDELLVEHGYMTAA